MGKNKIINIEDLDKNMKTDRLLQADIKWLSPCEEPFRVSGFAWFEQERLYRRLPAVTNPPLPAAVDSLANHTAGGQICFQTDSTCLSIKVRLDTAANMYHMPATGQCGFDCYIEKDGKWLYYSTTRYDHTKDEYECSLMDRMTVQIRAVLLYFPLYQGVQEIMVGIDKGADILPPSPYLIEQKVICYGTSITQGGCANRPGMAYSNILSRRFPLEFINLGFSGNGKGEPEVALLISDITQPACLVLDYEANCPTIEHMEQTLPEFISIYRSKHPVVPILVLSKVCFAQEAFHDEMLQKRLNMSRVQSEIVSKLRLQGDAAIYFQDGGELFGADFGDRTVDGVHPTDLGFHRMANRLTPVLADILKLS